MNQPMKTRRRTWIASTGAAMLLQWNPNRGIADDDAAVVDSAEDVQAAVDSGIEYLLKSQRPQGLIADRKTEVAVTSLAIMAIEASGRLSAGDRTEHDQVLQKAIGSILLAGKNDEKGYFGRADNSHMYGHAIATLMLARMLEAAVAVDKKEEIRTALARATNVILNAQKVEKNEASTGGWRYIPSSRDSDLSVSIWQLNALRAAKNSGVDIPQQSFDAALGFVRRCYTAEGPNGELPEGLGGFTYIPNGRRASLSMTAAGVSAMQLCQQADDPLAESGAKFLLQVPPSKNLPYLFYSTYHYAHAMHRAGGQYAAAAAKEVPAMLLGLQREDGTWLSGKSEGNVGKVYCTAMAILSLLASAEKSK